MKINNRKIEEKEPTYFIADIAASHDGVLERAIDLIYLCAEKGADAAKFQHFEAETIVSDRGFKDLGSQKSHQASWDKSVFEVYKDASLPFEWTEKLKLAADDAGIDFFTSPYSIELVDKVDKYVCAYKIGSGDITWHEIIRYMALKGKPCILASGAANLEEVKNALEIGLKVNNNFCLMQCNTNYTASLDNFNYINLNVLKTFKKEFPNLVLGLSDHTPGHSTVLGAVTLGARIIEKHFTDDNSRKGPDHLFSMNPSSWEDMILRTRELEKSLGIEEKKIEDNEIETQVLQQRSLRATNFLEKGRILKKDDFFPLRPCPIDGIKPFFIEELVGKTLTKNLDIEEHITWKHIKK
tara:strand:+ start:269 stop:1330 length:1062 start_codon:yes stop_codon:yes gene_type:complete